MEIEYVEFTHMKSAAELVYEEGLEDALAFRSYRAGIYFSVELHQEYTNGWREGKAKRGPRPLQFNRDLNGKGIR